LILFSKLITYYFQALDAAFNHDLEQQQPEVGQWWCGLLCRRHDLE
jgi:hypothetical protein